MRLNIHGVTRSNLYPVLLRDPSTWGGIPLWRHHPLDRCHSRIGWGGPA